MADHPEDYVLTLEEISIAERLLNSIISRYNLQSGENIEALSYSAYREKFTQPHNESVFGTILEESRLVAMWRHQGIVLVEGVSDFTNVHAIFNNVS